VTVPSARLGGVIGPHILQDPTHAIAKLSSRIQIKEKRKKKEDFS
jgi:hypothetical protein